MEIKDILKNKEYEEISKKFSQKEIEWINKKIKIRKDGRPGIECYIRGKNQDNDYFELKPEEIIRQLWVRKIVEDYGYDKNNISFEVPVVYIGKEQYKDKRIDIAIFENSQKKKLKILIEVKRPEIVDENKVYDNEASTPKQQLESYCLLKKAEIGVLVNGGNLLKFYQKPDFDNELCIDRFPKYDEDINDWLEDRRFTLKQLMLFDRLQNETLKDVILKVEQRFGANDSSDKAFEEIFKLIFTKLYDEILSSKDADYIASDIKRHNIKLQDIDDNDFRSMDFRVKEKESLDRVYERIDTLFLNAQTKWKGVFPKNSHLNMQKATVKSCVRELQNVKLFNSNLEVVDDAFEHLVNQNQKEGMGQYFTPRYVIDMCVRMLNPKPNEKMIDTAAGSCGFPMHTIFHVWKQLNPNAYNLFTTTHRKPEEIQYVENNVYGMDFSEKSVRVGRMLNIIAGDGHTNVLELNSLDYKNWDKDYVKDNNWSSKYREGFDNLQEMIDKKENEKYKKFNFDVLMANPPFAGDIDNMEQLSQYELSKNEKGQYKNKVGRDILFIERNLNFLKPGGRMAIVLPQGRFNNASDMYIRKYISDRCRILAVIGLHGNVFKPHTGTKTSVLIVQKWTDKKCGFPNICERPKKDKNGNIDYNIFFATMQEPSKDNSGEKIYVTENYVIWNEYEYEVIEKYIRKKDNIEVSFSQYSSDEDKKKYKIQIEEKVTLIEHKNEDGDKLLIKDIFIDKYGDLDSHRKYIKKNVNFVLKESKSNKNKKVITIEDYIALKEKDRALYKEMPIIGKNNNKLITIENYRKLDKKLQKYYDIASEIIEKTERIKDTHGHIFVKHDLFNHDDKIVNKNPKNIYSKDGIAEAFEQFALKEHLSFFEKARK